MCKYLLRNLRRQQGIAHSHPFPHVDDALAKLSLRGATMSVASSRGYGSLVELLEMLKVRH